MDRVGTEMKQRIRQLAELQFSTSLLMSWDQHEKDKVNYIVETILREYQPALGSDVIPRS
ncbi:hypothetical protein DD594_26515 [Enterobacter cloacae complex sp. 4DZ1-17B1]|nr:hypothetical protein DD594_26515 [Enterobacter cloacae complex sp. 4DZ1-17B1]